jgi:hypothetical protein
MNEVPDLTPAAIAELNQGTGPMPELTRIVDEHMAKTEELRTPDAGKTQERLQRADSIAHLNNLVEANRDACLSLVSISKQGVDVARNCLRTIEANDVRDSQVDLRIRELWSECEWLMQDMAKLYGERFYVAELPPVKVSIKGQLHSERLG